MDLSGLVVICPWLVVPWINRTLQPGNNFHSITTDALPLFARGFFAGGSNGDLTEY